LTSLQPQALAHGGAAPTLDTLIVTRPTSLRENATCVRCCQSGPATFGTGRQFPGADGRLQDAPRARITGCRPSSLRRGIRRQAQAIRRRPARVRREHRQWRAPSGMRGYRNDKLQPYRKARFFGSSISPGWPKKVGDFTKRQPQRRCKRSAGNGMTKRLTWLAGRSRSILMSRLCITLRRRSP
jgi:hypothetical protein